MSDDLKNADREKTNISRRGFLAGLATLAIGGAAVVTLGMNVADAAAETNVPNGPKDLTNNKTTAESKKTTAEGKKVEVAQNVDPKDPLQAFNQPYYRHRRRVGRRVFRRRRRVVRRTYRRVRRRVIF
jgi:hypothetical protein